MQLSCCYLITQIHMQLYMHLLPSCPLSSWGRTPIQVFTSWQNQTKLNSTICTKFKKLLKCSRGQRWLEQVTATTQCLSWTPRLLPTSTHHCDLLLSRQSHEPAVRQKKKVTSALPTEILLQIKHNLWFLFCLFLSSRFHYRRGLCN